MTGIFIFSAFAGMLAGLLAGLFGIGGGLILVPILALLFELQRFSADLIMVMAVATSLATIVLTSIASIIAHHRLGSVVWPKVYRLTPGILFGAALGAVVAEMISGDSLRIVFSLFLIYAGLEMALQIKPETGAVPQSGPMDFAAATLIGAVSSLLGIGGGTVMVPYLLRGGLSIRNAVGIASACGLPIAVGGTVSYMFLGRGAAGLPEWSWGYVYLPAFAGIVLCSMMTAPLGARLAHNLPAQTLKRYFSILVFIMAIKLLMY